MLIQPLLTSPQEMPGDKMHPCAALWCNTSCEGAGLPIFPHPCRRWDGTSCWQSRTANSLRRKSGCGPDKRGLPNASCNLIYSGRYFSNGYNGPEYSMPSYYELGCSLWKAISLKNYSLTVKGECINLTDHRYDLVANYPMPGRQFRLTFTVDLCKEQHTYL